MKSAKLVTVKEIFITKKRSVLFKDPEKTHFYAKDPGPPGMGEPDPGPAGEPNTRDVRAALCLAPLLTEVIQPVPNFVKSARTYLCQPLHASM